MPLALANSEGGSFSLVRYGMYNAHLPPSGIDLTQSHDHAERHEQETTPTKKQ